MKVLSESRRVSLLGSTGSVGTNALNVIRQHPESFKVVSLSCGSSLDLFLKQIFEFSPDCVSVGSSELADALRLRLPDHKKLKIFSGPKGHAQCIEETKPDVLMSAMAGSHGLYATLMAAKMGVGVLGIANKEILVMAGPFILSALDETKTRLVPVDSEHSAIFQALMGNDLQAVHSIILTGSGGPFRNRDASEFSKITKAEALKHPNWNMGAKITVDSATMMNKGLEYIEAIRLFGFEPEQVRIVVHPESIVHSLVEYRDGSLMAQLGISDMRIPIALALSYPHRIPLDLGQRLDLVRLGSLHFEAPDFNKFPCLKLAIESERMGAYGPLILNAANEVAVELFLSDQMRFIEIPELVSQSLEYFRKSSVSNLDDAIELDKDVKSWVLRSRFTQKMPISHRISGASVGSSTILSTGV